MKFLVFNLTDLHAPNPDATTRLGIRIIDAESMDNAKDLIRTCYPGAWAIVEKRTFDRGIVYVDRRAGEGGTP